MPGRDAISAKLVLALGQLMLGFGCLVWIYPPCENVCNTASQSLGFAAITIGLALAVLGIVRATSRWLQISPTERRWAELHEPQPSRLRALRLDQQIAFLGLPALILGFLLTPYAILSELGVSGTVNPTFAQIVNSADFLESAFLFVGSGLMTVSAGYLLGAWAAVDVEFEDKPLLLSAQQGSMWAVVSKMLQEEHHALPDLGQTPQPRIRVKGSRVPREGQSKLFIGFVFVILASVITGTELVLMVSHLLASL